MTTREDVLDAINRIGKAGHAGEATRAAQLDVLMLPPQEYERILNRLRAAFPKLFSPLSRSPDEAPEQQGVAAQAMKRAEAALAQQQTATAEFDRQVIEAIMHAHKTTGDGRRQLDDLESQIESAVRTWDLSTGTGAREFQRLLITKLDQIIKVVEEANDDNTSKQALAAAWAALYASQSGRDGSGRAGRDGAPNGDDTPSGDQTPSSEAFPDVDADRYLDTFPGDELEPGGEGAPGRSTPIAPAMPSVPGFGGAGPGVGSVPTGSLPAGLPLAGLLPGAQRGLSAEPDLDDEPFGADDVMPADDVSSTGEQETDNDEESAAATDRTTVRLPDGETVTVATPQLAAVMRAAVGGTPVADAFGRQGITIPPPGTPVPAPLDQSRVSPGDIGMFTDRQALALGNSKALLDGQIQHIVNVRGPSFLGWQHPPWLGEMAIPTRTPTPTRPSANVRA